MTRDRINKWLQLYVSFVTMISCELQNFQSKLVTRLTFYGLICKDLVSKKFRHSVHECQNT